MNRRATLSGSPNSVPQVVPIYGNPAFSGKTTCVTGFSLKFGLLKHLSNGFDILLNLMECPAKGGIEVNLKVYTPDKTNVT
jgi:hypothetical protein